MTTITKESGFIRIRPSTAVTVANEGNTTCAQGVQVYTPPSSGSLSTWIDFGNVATSVTRDGGSEDAAVKGVSADVQTALVIDGSSSFAVARQNGRKVIWLSSTSTGLTGTWVPFPPPAVGRS